MDFDLFFLLSYMATIAVADIPRGKIFEYAARLPSVASRFFREIDFMVKKLGYDYVEACRLVGSKAEEEVKNFLFRFSDAMRSGERESDFLFREAQIYAVEYENRYDRKLESLKKWTDAFAAMAISASLVFIIGVISTLIWDMGKSFLLSLAMLSLSSSAFGVWSLWRSSPAEVKFLSSREKGFPLPPWKLSLISAAFLLPVLSLGGMNMGAVLLLSSLPLLPFGIKALFEEREVRRRDEEIGAFLRSLGGVAAAVGTTLKEALARLNLRSIPSLAKSVKRLRIGLFSGINPDLCWEKFVQESKSELVGRSVKMFCDAIKLGGEAEEVGLRSSLFASRISRLRARRHHIAASFSGLMAVLHAALSLLLVFIVEVMRKFAELIAQIEIPQAPALPEFGFGFNIGDFPFVAKLLPPVLVGFCITNALAPYIVEGGEGAKLSLYLSLTFLITGSALLAVPKVADMIFGMVA